MTRKGEGHGSYVRKVMDGNQHYVAELLAENQRLRALAANLQVQHAQARDEAESLRGLREEAREAKARLFAAEQEARRARDELAEARAVLDAHARDRDRLQATLSLMDDENRRYSDEFAQMQKQANNLANLYVASYQVHGTLDRAELLDSLKAILANLVGCEEMALFRVDAAREELVLLDANGIDPAAYRVVPLGAGLIGAAVRSGQPLVVREGARRGPGEEELTAVIPLRLVDTVTAALAIFRLLPQKPALGELDQELFDLLASHAAMALHCTELHARSRELDPGAAAPARA